MPKVRCLLTAAASLAAGTSWAASPLSRLRGVSQYARRQAEAGPDHLWVGLAIAVTVACLVGAAALWTRQGKKT